MKPPLPEAAAVGGERPPLRLRAAVERLLREQAAAQAAERWSRPAIRGSRQAHPKPPSPQRARPRRLNSSITLRDGCAPPLPPGCLPTTQLVDAALAVITQGQHHPGDWRREGWLFRVALQAGCEAILEAGGRLPAFPLILRLETHPQKTAWLPMPRIPLPALFSNPGQRRQLGDPLRLMVNLERPCSPGEPPLAELLDEALDLLDANDGGDGHRVAGRWRRRRWLFRQMLRAVCEAVLASESGRLPLPLRVRFCQGEDRFAARPTAWQTWVSTFAPALLQPKTHPNPAETT